MKENLYYENISKYITIVIPTKNEEKYIEKTLEQITFQYGSSGIKVIIADNNSTDRTIELSTSFANRNHIDLIVADGGLPSVGRNKGAALVKTPYILFLDADVTFTKRTAIQSAFRKIIKKDYWAVSTTPIYSVLG
jgi:glycosyltransferase involved in cell wall biosynthesis